MHFITHFQVAVNLTTPSIILFVYTCLVQTFSQLGVCMCMCVCDAYFEDIASLFRQCDRFPKCPIETVNIMVSSAFYLEEWVVHQPPFFLTLLKKIFIANLFLPLMRNIIGFIFLSSTDDRSWHDCNKVKTDISAMYWCNIISPSQTVWLWFSMGEWIRRVMLGKEKDVLHCLTSLCKSAAEGKLNRFWRAEASVIVLPFKWM